VIPETSAPRAADPAKSVSGNLEDATVRPLSILALAIWCGLLAGLLGVGTLVLRKRTIEVNQLYDLRNDPEELRNRAAEPASQPRLAQMRAALNRLTAGPLTRARFSH
jgi:hypothetical protein